MVLNTGERLMLIHSYVTGQSCFAIALFPAFLHFAEVLALFP
jgi:hypothetical protein